MMQALQGEAGGESGAPKVRKRRAKKAPAAEPNGGANGHDTEPPAAAALAPEGEAPDSYRSDQFKVFVENYRSARSDLATAQADIRELFKAETERGLSKKAAQIALSMDQKIRNDTLSVQDAYATLEDAMTLLDWMGYEEERKRDLLRRTEEAGASPPT